MKLAIDNSDGIIQGSESIDPALTQYLQEKNVPFLPHNNDFDQNVEEINAFYEKLDA
jgi:starch synthase